MELLTRISTARVLISIPALAVARWMHGNDSEALAASLNVSHAVMRDWLEFVAPAVGVHIAA